MFCGCFSSYIEEARTAGAAWRQHEAPVGLGGRMAHNFEEGR